jgi:hypothetical protein
VSLRQGEFVSWRSPAGRPWYALVISADDYNAAAWPVCVFVVRAGAGSLYLVPLAETDPISGRVALSSLGALDPAEQRPAGMVSGPTWDRVQVGLRELLGL